MGVKTCPNGHKYDDSLPECPFCPKTAKQKRTVADIAEKKKTVSEKPSSNRPQTVRQAALDNRGSKKRTRVASSRKRGQKGESGVGKTKIISSARRSFGDKPEQMQQLRGKMVGWIVTFSWNKLGQDFQIREGKTRIGTEPGCDVVIEDALMSGDHAQMVFRAGKLKIKDSFSTNGTYVNGQDICDVVTTLNDGDVIRVGNTTFKLRLIGEVSNA